MDLPPSSTSLTTSALYSGVNERRFRFLDMWTSQGIVALNQVSTKPGEAHVVPHR